MSQDTTTTAPATATPSTGVSAGWRALSIFLVLALFIGWAFGASMYEQFKAQIHHLEAKLVEIPQVHEVAVLRLNEVKEGREQSLHVWAITDNDTPRLLGVLTDRYKTQQLDVPAQALEGARALGVSVENKDRGPYQGKPQQPWLFKGWLVQKAI
jgi:anti-sigma-K factor RskA